MEKYGTPQTVSDEDGEGIYKVSAEKLKDCCLKVLKQIPPPQEATCACGNKIVLEKA